MSSRLPLFVRTTPLLMVALALGCPEPIPSQEGGAPGTPGANGPAAGGPTPQAGGGGVAAGGGAAGGGAAGAPPSLGTFAGSIPESELTPLYTQDQLADGHTLSGTLICPDCSGALLVRVLPPPPDDPASTAAPQELNLITTASYDAAGAFSIRVPGDSSRVVLQVVDDADGDGRPSSGERMGMPEGGPITTGPSVTGIELTVGVFPEMPAMDGQGSPLSAAPAGAAAPTGAPPDGAPLDASGAVGPPPDGAPPLDGAPPPGGAAPGGAPEIGG